VPALLSLVAFAVLIGLGTWQMQRRAWKETLIATLAQRANSPPIALPPRPNWSKLDPAEDEFRRVRFTGSFRSGQEAHVFTSGSALRTDVSGIGYWVFVPAVVDGGLIVVNRGFVPEGKRDPISRTSGEIAGPVTITGALRWPEPRTWFSPADDPAHDLWLVRDQSAMAAAKNWGEVAPFYIEQDGPVPPGGLPKPGRLSPNLPNNHLQYALTWYALALVLAGIFIVWVRGRHRVGARG
jgi:surfeit locus 1 family protein